MREIKFRGKDINLNRWVYGGYKTVGDGVYIIAPMPGVADFNHEVIPESVGQFTGLLDANGVEIYEGDILRHHGQAVSGDKPKPARVEYEEGRFLARFVISANMTWVCKLETQFEVIGNETDNPELLQNEQEKEST